MIKAARPAKKGKKSDQCRTAKAQPLISADPRLPGGLTLVSHRAAAREATPPVSS